MTDLEKDIEVLGHLAAAARFALWRRGDLMPAEGYERSVSVSNRYNRFARGDLLLKVADAIGLPENHHVRRTARLWAQFGLLPVPPVEEARVFQQIIEKYHEHLEAEGDDRA